jgi:hypothetical protein
MIAIFETARELQDFCDRGAWSSSFIGGIAVQRWDQARVTRDVDITLLTGFGEADSFIEPLLAHYAPRSAGAADFARRARVLLLRSPSGIGIDISSAGCHSSVLLSSGPCPLSSRRGSASASAQPGI